MGSVHELKRIGIVAVAALATTLAARIPITAASPVPPEARDEPENIGFIAIVPI
jgi:hypothetical protein